MPINKQFKTFLEITQKLNANNKVSRIKKKLEAIENLLEK